MKKFLKFFAITLAIVVLFVAFIPAIVSTEIGKPLIVSAVNRNIKGTLHADEIRAGWFSGVELGNVTVEDLEGKQVAAIAKISYDTPLFSLLYSKAPTGTLKVEAPQIALTDAKGQIALQSLFQPAQNSAPLPHLTLKNIELSLDMQAGETATLDLQCVVVGEGQKPGTVALHAKAKNLLSLQDALQSILTAASEKTAAEADISLAIDALPVAGSIFEQAVGPNITLNLQQSLRDNELKTHLTLDSAFLRSEIEAEVQNGVLNIPKKAFLHYTVMPDFIAKLTPNIASAKPVTFQLALDPIHNASLQNLKDVPLTFAVTQDKPLSLTKQEWPAPLFIRFDGNIHSKSLAKELRAAGVVTASMQGEEIKGQVAAELLAPFTNPHGTFTMNVDGKAEALTAFLDKRLIGDKITLSVHTVFEEKKVNGSWNINSPTIQNKGSFLFSDNRLVVEPTTLHLALPPESLQGKISTPLKLHAELKSAELTDDLANGALDLAVSIEPLKINDMEIQYTSLTVKKEKEKHAAIVATTSVDAQKIHAKIKLVVDSLDLAASKIAAMLTVVNDNDQLMPFEIEAPIVIDRERKKVSGSIDFRGHKETAATLKARFDLMPQQARFESLPPFVATTSGSFHNFPVSLLSMVTERPELVTLLGNELSGKWNMGYDASLQKPETLSLSMQGQELSLDLAVDIKDELSGKNPLALTWTMTPERFQTLQKLIQDQKTERPKELTLQKPVVVALQLKKINLPFTPFLEGHTAFTPAALLDLLTFEMGASSSAFNATLIEKKEEGKKLPLFLPPVTLAGTLAGKTFSFKVISNKTINIQGHAKDLWGPEGLHLEQADIKLDIKIDELPLELLQGFTTKPETAERLVALFGKNISADIKGNVENLSTGTFDGTITSPTLKSSVSCSLQEGNLTLNSPLLAQYELTPEAGETLLKDINPLLVSAARTQKPITLKIDSEGFFVPLRPFTMKGVKIKNIAIDPGILTCKNSGMLSLLVSLLKVDVKKEGDVDLWFTPIYAEVKKGVVHCKRTDALLANAFPIATWGSINLEKNSVDMILGLSGKAISHAFGVKDLPQEYLLQIPIHGPTNSPKFDTARATAKITGMKMQQKSSNTTALLGGLLEIAASAGEKEEPAPPPTTQPFPWAKEIKN